MSGFSAEWLSLRERYDCAARNAKVLDAVRGHFAGQTALAVVDLACGTGSTVRTVGPYLPVRQNWLLVDNDLSLLARTSTLSQPPNLSVTARPVDLARDLELALDGPLDLVTASALLDLVSAEWLDRLIIEAAVRRLPIYAALTYDGRTTMQPAGSFDKEVLVGFNAHQRTDKGFGLALGPAAATRAIDRFEHFGYAVVQGRSDWVFGPEDRAIQEALFEGYAEVAALTTQMTAAEIGSWLAQRRYHLAEGRSHLRIGHVDMFAWPTGKR
jgi:hypothetical protein